MLDNFIDTILSVEDCLELNSSAFVHLISSSPDISLLRDETLCHHQVPWSEFLIFSASQIDLLISDLARTCFTEGKLKRGRKLITHHTFIGKT